MIKLSTQFSNVWKRMMANALVLTPERLKKIVPVLVEVMSKMIIVVVNYT